MTDEYRWYIGLLGDGTYRFITPNALESAEKYIGKHGGAVYSHAGYLIFAATHRWWEWLDSEHEEKYGNLPSWKQPPHIDVPNIECSFSPDALEWLQNNEAALKEIGGKYYEFIPKH